MKLARDLTIRRKNVEKCAGWPGQSVILDQRASCGLRTAMGTACRIAAELPL